jgi:DNA-directed RNA polymerase I subunit RPA49
MDAAAQAMLASMAKDTEAMATRDQLAAEANAAKPRPTANLAAADIKDVYTVDSLIGLEILKMVPVLDWQKNIKAKVEIEVKSEYVAHRIVEVSQNPEKLKILRYMNMLIDLYKSSPEKFLIKKLPQRQEMSRIRAGVPEAVMESVLRRFTYQNTMTKYQADLMITHICALACLVDNFVVDLYDLQADLGLNVKLMSQYFQEIGAKITALDEERKKKLKLLDKAVLAQRKLAKLKLPLEFPKLSFGKRK